MEVGTMELQRPEVIISDFDRTLAYLYRNEQLLLELAQDGGRFFVLVRKVAISQ